MPSAVSHHHLKQSYPTTVFGDGVYLIDSIGKRYIDACGGAAVSCLGYSYEPLKTVMKAQIDQLPFIHSAFFTTDILEQIAVETNDIIQLHEIEEIVDKLMQSIAQALTTC